MSEKAFTIVVPAKDEAELVGECLDSIVTAAARTHAPVAVVLVAHHCTDNTEAIAQRIFSRLRGMTEGLVVRLDEGNVATARSVGAMAGLHLLSAYGIPFQQTWLLSTDADSRVPPDWITSYQPHLNSGAAAVAGMVRVRGWEEGPAQVPSGMSEAYRQVVRAGLREDGHDHVYGANLAVRADAYLDVGGWPDQVPGEDAALLDGLRRNGWPVSSAPEVVVSTSGRVTPRAPGGLGALLGRLIASSSSTDESVPAAARTGGRNALIIPRQALRSRS